MLSNIIDKIFLPPGGGLLPLTPTNMRLPHHCSKIILIESEPFLVLLMILKYLRTILKIKQTKNPYHLYLFVCVYVDTRVCVKVRVQLTEVSSLLPLCGFQRLT